MCLGDVGGKATQQMLNVYELASRVWSTNSNN